MTLLPPKPIVALGITKTCIEENMAQTRIVLAAEDKPLAHAIKDATGVSQHQ